MRKYICPECEEIFSNKTDKCENCERPAGQVLCENCETWSALEENEVCPKCENLLKESYVVLDLQEELDREKLIENKYVVVSREDYGTIVADEKPNLSTQIREPRSDLENAYSEMGYLKDIVKVKKDDYLVTISPFKAKDQKYSTLQDSWKNLGNFEKIKYLKQFINLTERMIDLRVTKSLTDGEVFLKNGSIFIFPLLSDEDFVSIEDIVKKVKDSLREKLGSSDFVVQKVFVDNEDTEQSIEEIMEALDEVKESLETRFALESYGSTDLGPVRDNNEDDFFSVEFCFSQPDSLLLGGRGLKQRGLYLLCDGMGGHQKGEVASALIVRELRKRLMPLLVEEIPPNNFEEEVKEIIKESNDVLLEVNILEGIPAHEGRMGTTLVAVIAFENEIFITHVGDSRCYMLGEENLELLTEDHNLASQALHAGTFKTREEAEQMRGGKVLTQAIGPREGTHLLPDSRRIVIKGDCYLLLCSDGLTDVVTDDEIKELIRNGNGNLRRIVTRMIQTAYDQSTRDNITALLVRFKQRM